jgi:integrase
MVKNLDTTTETKTVMGDKKNPDAEGQILQHLVYLKNDGKRDTTIEQRDWLPHNLIHRGANFSDPESIKHAIAQADVSEGFKSLMTTAYDMFAKANGINWKRPGYKQKSPLPFCLHESEIDALINGSGKKLSTLLLTLKETAMRLGEAWQVEWTDLDTESRTLVCNHPEKKSKPIIFKISAQLVEMLQNLPKINQYIFTCSPKTQKGHEDPNCTCNYLNDKKPYLHIHEEG